MAVGILRRHTRGKHVLFQANQDCPIFPELRALVEKTLGAPILLRRLLTPFAPGIRVALLFGSWARAQTTTGSDLDLLVVGDVSPLRNSATARSAQRSGIGSKSITPTSLPPRSCATGRDAQGNRMRQGVRRARQLGKTCACRAARQGHTLVAPCGIVPLAG